MALDVVSSVLDAGIDWVTFTEEYDSTKGTALRQCAAAWLNDSAQAGAGLSEQKPQGFVGAGNEFGFMGVRERWLMVRVSGRNTTDFFERTLKYGTGFHATRIDFQVTAGYDSDQRDFAGRLLGTIRRSEKAAGRQERSKAVLYQAHNRDTGVSVGARTGECFLRCYHPRSAGHVEYDDKAVRFEVEYKGDRAAQTYNLATRCDGIQYLAASLVQSELLHHGIAERWFQAQNISRPKTRFESTTNEKRFEWFKASVMPALTKLMEDPRFRDKITGMLSDARRETLGKVRPAALEAALGESAYWKAKEFENL